MEDLNAAKQRTHKLMLTNRRTCTISGVCDVLSFDVKEVLLETDQGMLMIKGEDLHVSRLTLDKGEVDVDGKIDSFTYSEVTGYGSKGESLLPRLFKYGGNESGYYQRGIFSGLFGGNGDCYYVCVRFYTDSQTNGEA